MADTYTWNLYVEGATVATLDLSKSYLPANIPANTDVQLVIYVVNSGSKDGIIYYKLVQNPGAGEQIIGSASKEAAAGQEIAFTTTINFPVGEYILGIKVWGEDETEPSW